MATRRSSETTSPRADTAASKTLRNPNASSATKSAAGSALAQAGNDKVTGKQAASAAGKTLSNPSTSKAGKSAAALALTQRHDIKKK
ncbi:hypothetical protein [Candidatus Magnetaquicoccus inordinatus]|uniref:hypothetical protein n=1 Tax=Candidatus Magnetaquicoccus inordinatus TaxID=2496818 RepID=UPI00102C0FD8|nr:hypothetical protein [Candidatus Magnetaquicoccus inordinatus]